MANVMATTGTLRWYLKLDGGLVLGPVAGAYYSLFQNEISNIPTFTPSLFNQTHRITRSNVHTGLWLRTGCVTNAQVRFLNAQVSKKNGRYQTIVAGKKHC